MSLVTQVYRKSMLIRPSGRSTDYISPSFGHGCLYKIFGCLFNNVYISKK